MNYEAINLILQTAYYVVAIIGVFLAVFHYLRFLKDRSAKNLLDLSVYMANAAQDFSDAMHEKRVERNDVSRQINSLTVYCHLHNSGLLDKNQRDLHEKFVARRILFMLSNYPSAFKSKKRQIEEFVLSNSSLFERSKKVIEDMKDAETK